MIATIDVFWLLLLYHLLYDFHWQGDFIANGKRESLFLLAVHVATWTIGMAVILCMGEIAAPWKFAFLAASHFATDGWKARLPRTTNWFWAIYVDQGIHLVSLVVVVFL